MRAGALAAVALASTLALSLLAAVSACGSSKTECSCVDTALVVHVPESRASLVTDITLSGAACARAQPACVKNATTGPGCVAYRVPPVSAGSCELDIDFAQGAPRFSAVVSVVNGNSCCGGFVADPPSAADVEVPG